MPGVEWLKGLADWPDSVSFRINAAVTRPDACHNAQLRKRNVRKYGHRHQAVGDWFGG
jgi:hypothetical protein